MIQLDWLERRTRMGLLSQSHLIELTNLVVRAFKSSTQASTSTPLNRSLARSPNYASLPITPIMNDPTNLAQSRERHCMDAHGPGHGGELAWLIQRAGSLSTHTHALHAHFDPSRLIINNILITPLQTWQIFCWLLLWACSGSEQTCCWCLCSANGHSTRLHLTGRICVSVLGGGEGEAAAYNWKSVSNLRSEGSARQRKFVPRTDWDRWIIYLPSSFKSTKQAMTIEWVMGVPPEPSRIGNNNDHVDHWQQLIGASLGYGQPTNQIMLPFAN